MKKLSLGFISFLQAAGITFYCFIISNVFLHGSKWFGPVPIFLGPALFLMLFVVSAIICTIIFGGYAFLLFWEHKNTKSAIKLIGYTTSWLAFFTLSVIIFLSLLSK